MQVDLQQITQTTEEGALSSFLPANHGLFQIELFDFSIGDIMDCQADGVTVVGQGMIPTVGGGEWLPVTIFGRGVGPVLLDGIFPLQSYTVSGITR